MKPKSDQTRLQQQQQSEATHQSKQKTEGHDFASVEELLRYDAAQVTPPASIATRLQDSIDGRPKSKRSWWRRLFPK